VAVVAPKQQRQRQQKESRKRSIDVETSSDEENVGGGKERYVDSIGGYRFKKQLLQFLVHFEGYKGDPAKDEDCWMTYDELKHVDVANEFFDQLQDGEFGELVSKEHQAIIESDGASCHSARWTTNVLPQSVLAVGSAAAEKVFPSHVLETGMRLSSRSNVLAANRMLRSVYDDNNDPFVLGSVHSGGASSSSAFAVAAGA
jgi:hypothetical protein